MADLEKVKRGLECCKAFLCKDGKCPYYGSMCQSSLATDALELLKEQKEIIKQIVELEIQEASKVKEYESKRDYELYHIHNAKYEAYSRVLAIIQGEDGETE